MLNILEQQSKIIARLPVLNLPQFNLPDYIYLQALKIPDSIRRVAETIKRFQENPEMQFSFLQSFITMFCTYRLKNRETKTSGFRTNADVCELLR